MWPDAVSSTIDPYLLRLLRQPELHEYARRILDDADEAEDAIQDVAERLATGVAPISAPLRFLRRSVRNAALDRLRARERHAALHQRAATSQRSHGEAGIAGDAEFRTNLDLVDAALARQPRLNRDVFRLHYIEGLGQEVIASRLEVSLSTVEKRLATVRRACMRALLQPPA